jgi:HEAT repeat protein
MASARELSHNHEMKFSLWRSCLLGTLCVGLVGCASAPVRESVRRYESGDFAGSRAAAKAALARSESDDDAWGMKLRAELALGDAGAVMETYAAYQQRRGSDDAVLLRDVAQATLGQGLKSPAARVRMAAIVGVEAAEIEDLADAVMALLGDDNPQVAVTAALAVLSGHPDAAKIAEIALKNDDPAVRRIAVNGVGKKVGMLAVADIRAAATDHDAGVRRIAVRWLGQLKDADSVDTLRGRLRDKDDGVRGAAATALAKIATSSATKLDLAGRYRPGPSRTCRRFVAHVSARRRCFGSTCSGVSTVGAGRNTRTCSLRTRAQIRKLRGTRRCHQCCASRHRERSRAAVLS